MSQSLQYHLGTRWTKGFLHKSRSWRDSNLDGLCTEGRGTQGHSPLPCRLSPSVVLRQKLGHWISTHMFYDKLSAWSPHILSFFNQNSKKNNNNNNKNSHHICHLSSIALTIQFSKHITHLQSPFRLLVWQFKIVSKSLEGFILLHNCVSWEVIESSPKEKHS